MTLANSIIAGNGPGMDVRGAGVTDIDGPIVSHGGNLIGQIGATTGWVASDKIGTAAHPLDARLAPLGNYGGPTPTMPPLAGSPAVGAGVVSAIPSGVTTDQRGAARVISGAVDIGAVEVQGPPTIHVTPPSSQQFTGAGTVTLGSFTAPGISGPFLVDIHWGDGTPDTVLHVSGAGSIPSQFHRFGGLGVFQPKVAITDGVADLSNLATFNATVVAAGQVGMVVNTTKDQLDSPASATVSLRDAVARANQALGPVAISFDPTVFASAQTIPLTGTALIFSGNPFGTISISGTSAGLTLSLGTINGPFIEGDAIVAFHGLTLTSPSANAAQIVDYGHLTIDRSTALGLFSIYNTGTLALTDSAVVGGTATGSQGMILNSGIATINDCTISGNSGAGVQNSGTAVISDSTITANYGYGLVNLPGDSLTLSNSIVANTTSNDPATVSDVSGAIKSLGHNLIGKKDHGTGWISSDLTGTIAHPLDAKISPLGNYGGPTPTQYLLPGSPALNAGSVSLIPAGVTMDQRGFNRVVGGKVDIGAFQSQSASAIAITPPAAQSVVAGVAATVNLGSFTDAGNPGPYIVTIEWGDGTPSNTFTQIAAGSLGTQGHTFITTGNLTGTIIVVDSAGNLKQASFGIASAVAPLKTIVVNTIYDTTDPATARPSVCEMLAQPGRRQLCPRQHHVQHHRFRCVRKPSPWLGISPPCKAITSGKISILGPAVGVTIKSHLVVVSGPDGDTITGNVFTVVAGITASLSNVTLTQLGFVTAGSLTLTDCTISGNSVMGADGAGINNSGSLTLLDSTVTGNTATTQFYRGGYASGGRAGESKIPGRQPSPTAPSPPTTPWATVEASTIPEPSISSEPLSPAIKSYTAHPPCPAMAAESTTPAPSPSPIPPLPTIPPTTTAAASTTPSGN